MSLNQLTRQISFDFSALTAGTNLEIRLQGNLIKFPSQSDSVTFNVKVYSFRWLEISDISVFKSELPLSIYLNFEMLPDNNLEVDYEAHQSDGLELLPWM